MMDRLLTLRRFALVAAFVVLVAAVAAGCGGGNDEAAGTGSDEPAATGGDGGAGAAIEGARANLEEHRAVPEWTQPGPEFDAKEATQGKSLFVIPASSQVPFVATIANNMKRVADDVGFKLTIWQNQGQPSQWVQGMDAAVAQNASAIVLLAGIDPASLQPQIKAAKAKGIPTIVAHLYDDDQESAPNVGGLVNIPYKLAGRLIADQAIVDTEGEANAVVITINQVKSTEPMVEGIKEEFEQYCDGCKLTFTDVTIADLATKVQPNVQAALTSDPSINYVIALYDSAQAPFAQAAIRAAGKTGQVKISTFNGTPEILKEVAGGDIIAMDVAENLDWIAYAVIDQSMRIMGGLDPVENAHVPIRVFDDSNIDEAGDDFQSGFGDEYASRYEQLWGIG